ncbi:MAG: exodeoxyribonuclease VII large subunit [Bacteroidota bacterium]
MSDERQIFTLQQVASSIRKTIENRYTSSYWLKAELHKINLFASGHAFPELVQKEDGKIVAQMRGIVWKSNFDRINQQFIQVVKEPLKEGSVFLMQVKVTFTELYGVSLQILAIDPSFSLGELQRQREETLNRLQKEGLLNLNQLLKFPLLPQRVAIISAETSKGLSDFMKVIEQNPFGYKFFTMLFKAHMQGDQAAPSMITKLERIRKVLHHFDVVVIVRGGGDEVGLTCYNDFELCKAIATFPIPVLTGIGHSTNLTVAEMIGYRSAITPTELGEFLIQVFHEFAVPVENATRSLKARCEFLLGINKIQFSKLIGEFKNANGFLLQNQEQSIENLVLRLKSESQNKMMRELATLQQIEGMVRVLDPKSVLKRGFSIAKVDDKIIDASTKLSKGMRIQTQTFDQIIESEIIEIQ